MQVIIINSLVCACALTGFIIGSRNFSDKRMPLYLQLVTLALGCAFLGRLYNIVVIICDGAIPRTFNMGVLAAIGCFMFIFSANFGEMDSLCEKRLPGNRKFIWIGFAAPAVFAATAACIVVFSREDIMLRLAFAAVLVSVMLASYYNLKHLLIHDVDDGIIKSIRGYNLIALLLELLYAAEMAFDAFELEVGVSVVDILMSACLLAVVPVLKKEITNWRSPFENASGAKSAKKKAGGAAK